MTLTMNDLLSPGFITIYILGFIFLTLVTRFTYDSFSEYMKDFIKPTLLLLGLMLFGIVFCYMTYYYNQQLSGNFDIKETIKGNR